MLLRVASVPGAHPYVEHLAPLEPDGTVVRLPDPPVVGENGETRWWPPRMLDPEWLREHAGEYDVLHMHFGFESFTPQHLADVVETAHELGKGVVLTVHDLHNPHIAEADVQLDRLDELVPRADEIITLTDGAAIEIKQRWGREASVIPHPHIVELDSLPARAPRLSQFSGERPARVNVHLKNLRANTDAVGAIRALAALPEHAHGVVTIHRAVLDPSDRGYSADVAEALEEARDHVEVIVHEPMSDGELHAHLRGCDVSVLPYVWGTHSGWIEMCHDLGVRVVAPKIGFYGEQHTPTMYDLAEPADGSSRPPTIDPRALTAAILESLERPAPRPAGRANRAAQRDAIAAAHLEIYQRAVGTHSR